MKPDECISSFAYREQLCFGVGAAKLYELPAGARWPTVPVSSSMLAFLRGSVGELKLSWLSLTELQAAPVNSLTRDKALSQTILIFLLQFLLQENPSF
jgi:hypothetical protein